MYNFIITITGGRLLLLAILPTAVAAADDAEFAFNLLSDFAPVLALFGDEFAKQFTSESLTWVDHLIFAMVPLGIITAITGAIRVQGMQIAKAFIGRSRETRALAEIELMSSTSGEVCELFNGNSIVRLMGKPKIGQILIFPSQYDSLEAPGIDLDGNLMRSESERAVSELNDEKPEDEKPKDEKPKDEKPKDEKPKDEESEGDSCGIHSLQTAATSRSSKRSRLMEYKPYSSDSAAMAKRLLQSASKHFRDLRSHPSDQIKIPVTRKTSSHKWKVDIGKIDATLSLWMASIETDTRKPVSPYSDDASSDWRRAKAGDDLTYSFERIIGSNLKDGMLKRDISWWVDSLLAEQSDAQAEDNTPSDRDDVKIVIGFNGYEKSTATSRELGITAKAPLHVILAQHLFTSFMWTVAEYLPRGCFCSGPDEVKEEVEVEGLRTFNSDDFAQTWLRPRLRHRKLIKIIRSMESFGLGSTTDILLCMIPALSFKRLLPNQAILRLMPRVGSGRGWLETATCYRQLLETIEKNHVSVDDRLGVAATVASIDFLSLAYEHLELPPYLSKEVGAIEQHLASAEFAGIMDKLEPAYRQQNRHELFQKIVRRKTDQVSGLDREFSINVLGFTRHHLAMFEAKKQVTSNFLISDEEKEKYAKVHDIFGWTPYHYGCLDNGNFPRNVFMPNTSNSGLGPIWAERLPELLDNLGRSPMHIAALSGKCNSLEFMLDGLGTESRKSVMHATGFDKMTLLHLISKSGHVECLELDWGENLKHPVAEKDIWGRQALHIASMLGHTEIATKLLEMGSRSDEFDEVGKCPIDYYVERSKDKHGEDNENSVQEQQSDDSSTTDLPIVSGGAVQHLSKKSFSDLLKFAVDPASRYRKGKSFLHVAVEVADDDSIRELKNRQFRIEAKDDDGRTPLHYAVVHGRAEVFSIFLEHFKADPLAKDSCNVTALMLAAQKNLVNIAKALLTSTNPVKLEDTDDDKKTALHHTRGKEMAEFLVLKKCNVLATDSDGRTALHTAIEEKHRDVAHYLLTLKEPKKLQQNPFDDRRESLLITVCKHGFSELVPEILTRWPEIINMEDSYYKQPPISWACEKGFSDIVKYLLQHQDEEGHIRVDLNKIATLRRGLTPLHFAVGVDDTTCLDLLLKQKEPSAELDRESTTGETPLARAVVHQNVAAARMLLLDPRTSPEQRFHYLKKLTSYWNESFHYLIRPLLQTLLDTHFICAYFIEIRQRTLSSTVEQIINEFVKDLRKGDWRKLQTPYHLAILLEDGQFAELLRRADANQRSFDEDNWAPMDYLERFCRNETFKSHLSYLKPFHAGNAEAHKEPTTLIWTPHEKSVKVVSCSMDSHSLCSKVHEIEVVRDLDYQIAFARSDHSVPPSKKHFYFEVEAIRNSKYRILGIGFCGSNIKHNQMPGWFEGSWGYHGDDGHVFAGFAGGSIPSSDFGDSATFQAGDVAGVCLNVETGQGFCTRNGNRLNMGNVFKAPDERFNSGKMYPCIGVGLDFEDDVGLRFKINFDGSDKYPFKYGGDFDFE
ncbi:Ankyrin-3 [Colletotrichum fructicola]|nr:Ankyrin-3 [Colletotrichum fructicola]